MKRERALSRWFWAAVLFVGCGLSRWFWAAVLFVGCGLTGGFLFSLWMAAKIARRLLG